MTIVDLPIHQLQEARWNPNVMDISMLAHLRESMRRYGPVVPPVVRATSDGLYEVLSGNQRLRVLLELGYRSAPCLVVDLDDAQARLLAQALNHIHGGDDLGLKAELVRELLKAVPAAEVLSVLPETTNSLKALASLGQEDMGAHLEAWQAAQSARLKHFQAQLTSSQLEVVEEALDRFLPHVSAGDEGNPNRRGLALYRLCSAYLGSQEDSIE